MGIYGKFKSDVIQQEKRLTILEKDVEHLTEFKAHATIRLDNHDKQNEALARLSANIEYLSKKVDNIDKRLGGTVK